jgi:hypothetical protein
MLIRQRADGLEFWTLTTPEIALGLLTDLLKNSVTSYSSLMEARKCGCSPSLIFCGRTIEFQLHPSQ